MNERDFSIVKNLLVEKLSNTAKEVQSLSFDNFLLLVNQFNREEDPYEVAIHEIYSRAINNIAPELTPTDTLK